MTSEIPIRPPRFIFIESNTTGTGELFPKAALSLGFDPVMLVADPARYSYLANGTLDYLVVDTSDVCQIELVARQLGESGSIAGFYSSSEHFIAAAARLAQLFGMPGDAPAAISACRDKALQRNALAAAKLLVPQYYRIKSLADLRTLISNIPIPCVIKPIAGSGSVGVRLCQTPSQVLEHGARLLRASVNERGLPHPSEVIVESFVEGPEFSAEMFGSTLIGITRKHLGEEPYFVEHGHDYPARFASEDLIAVRDMCTKAITAVGLGWGPTHIEFRLSTAGPTIIEINPRLAGGMIPELVRRASGIDLIKGTVALAAGLTPDLGPRRESFASLRFIVRPRDGTTLDAPLSSTNFEVNTLVLYDAANTARTLYHDFRDRIGHVMTANSDREAAIRSVESAERAISSRHFVSGALYG